VVLVHQRLQFLQPRLDLLALLVKEVRQLKFLSPKVCEVDGI
jgi:hypothetical protein